MPSHRVRICSLPIVILFACGTAQSAERRVPIVVSPDQSAQDKIAALKPGDVLLLKAGIHKGSLTLSGLNGTAESPITIHGEKGAQIVPTERDGILFWPKPCSHVVIEGLKIEKAQRAGVIISSSKIVVVRNCVLGHNGVWGVQTTLSDFITVEGCEIYGSVREHGVYFSTTDHPVARGNCIYNCAGCGIHNNGDTQEGGDGMITGGLYEGNTIYECGRRGGAAINMDGVEQSVVRNNLIYRNLAGGIVSFHGNGHHSGDGNRFINNTVHFAPGVGRFGLQLAGGRNAQVFNNILLCGRGPALEIMAGGDEGLQSDHNVLLRRGGAPVLLNDRPLSLQDWRRASAQDAHSSSADPLFVDEPKGDFRLKAGSPAIDAGRAIEGLTTDPKNSPRPAGKAFDIGAFESQPRAD